MRAVLFALLVVAAFAAAPVPVADAHHIVQCADYPCDPQPCSWKCWIEHVRYCALYRDCA